MEVKKKKDLNERWLNNKRIWFDKIEDKDTALKIIKECVYCFYFIAALNVIIGFFLSLGFMIDGIIFAVCAFLLSKFKHVVIAIILLIISCASLIITMVNNLTHAKGGSNMFLAVALVWISTRAVQATVKLRREKNGNKTDLSGATNNKMPLSQAGKKVPLMFKICIFASISSFVVAVCCAIFGFFDAHFKILDFLFSSGMVLFGIAMYIGLQAGIFNEKNKIK